MDVGSRAIEMKNQSLHSYCQSVARVTRECVKLRDEFLVVRWVEGCRKWPEKRKWVIFQPYCSTLKMFLLEKGQGKWMRVELWENFFNREEVKKSAVSKFSNR